MTLTVVVGSSGSGKTTFLNDVHKSHKCIYIRQYHKIRPHVVVTKIPNFDCTRLPFWDIYEREGTAGTIPAGGTMAGKFTAGLSGGQRKLLLFELVVQRVALQSNLLICLDEPFAGVTDDFVPFIVQRLEALRQKHQILLVTNDHVETLKKLADNIITVSAIDRSKIQINQRQGADREKAILALSVGSSYVYKASRADIRFFLDVEVLHNGNLLGIAIFSSICFAMYMVTFWNSSESNAALVLIAGGVVNFFSANPHFVALTDWRNFISEEAEALVHASKSMNKILETLLAIAMFVILATLQFGITNAVIGGFQSYSFWIAMLFDSSSLLIPFLICGLYTRLPLQATQILARLPFLFMLFFSTTFSPGAGLPGLKALRHLFPRFYFWCMVPSVQDQMESCPESEGENLLYLVLSSLVIPTCFLIIKGIMISTRGKKKKKASTQKNALKDDEFHDLRRELFGERANELDVNSTIHSSP